MAISFEIDPAAGLMVTEITGPLFDADLPAYLSDVLAHPDFRPGLCALVFCRGVQARGISTGGIRRLTQFTRAAESRLQGSRVAVIVDQIVVFGLARMYQLIRSPPYDLHVFHHEKDAREWLGLDPS